MKKVGFLGGSFDPPHIGHIHLAIRLKEIFGLDHVIFSPASVSPFKVESPPIASSELRLQMARDAFEGIEGFEVCDFELGTSRASFTIDTIRHFIERDMAEGKKQEYHLLLGEDVLHGLSRWKEAPSLIDLASPLIGTREGFDYQELEGFERSVCQKIISGYAKIPSIDVSSTDIRNRLASGLYVGHLVVPKVLDTIYKHRIYSCQ